MVYLYWFDICVIVCSWFGIYSVYMADLPYSLFYMLIKAHRNPY